MSPSPSRLECVVVCVNYADFLAHTLPHNKNQFDRMVVVTDTKDSATKALCEFYHVQCVQTDAFYQNGDTFNKGAGINEGLKCLSREGWVLHLDADIYLPPLTRTILDNLPLQAHKVYGCDRLMCPSYEEWLRFLDSPRKIQEGWVFIHPTAFPMGVRIAEYHTKGGGYEPIGYFQLWNPKGSGVYEYPTEHGFADRTDVLHVKRFTRENRELLPELLVIHLESEGLAEMGANWRGRKTRLFSGITAEAQAPRPSAAPGPDPAPSVDPAPRVGRSSCPGYGSRTYRLLKDLARLLRALRRRAIR